VHIPDGYLSPATCGVFGAVMLPIWYKASRAVGKIVKSRYVPLLAIGAAFSFLVMMFNVPAPFGTTAHAVGATIIAIVLGPWAAVIAVTISLVIQALFFGDGGVLALSVNCFNMAFVLPFVGYYVYRAIAANTSLTSGRRALAAGIGGYVGINAAALCAAIELGVQPTLFHTAAGAPLYAPFHLTDTIPAIMLAHLTIAGVAEFVATAGVVAYLQRANVPVLRINHAAVPVTDEELVRKRMGWRLALAGLAAAVVLTPIGLLASGSAFGEDAPDALNLAKYHLSAVPTGLAKFNSFWSHALLGGYGFHSGDNPVIGYLLSAVVGIVAIALAMALIVLIARLFVGRAKGSHDDVRAEEATPVARAGESVTIRGRSTPAWLVAGESGLSPCDPVGRRKKGSFIEKTLGGAANVMRLAMFSDDLSAQDGLLQKVDPRVKILSLMSLLLATAFLRNVPALITMYALTLVLAVASRLPLGFFVKRVWLFIPIFTGIIVIPAMFSFITPGHIILPLWTWQGDLVGITAQGLQAAGLIVMRVATSVSLVVLLTVTTPWMKLLAALRALMVPKIFILIIGMAYRYIFLLLNSVTDMYTARKSRSVGNAQPDVKQGQRFVTASAGAIFGKSHTLSEEVHMAMVSRGYTGNARTLSGFRIRAMDLVFAAACTVGVVLTLGGDRIVGR
jgi:cobalt/nickel transport system permease protein